jgi:leucyl aminopeptidase (aminopeptidase T)
MATIETAAYSVLKQCLDVKKQESVLIVGDLPKADLALEFYQNARKLSEACTFLVLPPLVDGYEPSQSVHALMEHSDAAVLVTSRSLSHTNARRAASRKGARIVSLPGITAESLIRTMDGDYQSIADRSRKIADIFTIGHTGRLTTPAGTDLAFSILRMKGHADTGLARESGQFSNTPAGEGCAAPVQGSTQGILVVDGSFPVIGKIDHPIRMTVKNGYVSRIFGGDEAGQVRKLLQRYGKPGKNIAEIGIGTNPKARLTGFTLEDEKVLGTAHVALGNNLSFDGRIGVHCHFDGILLKPTMIIDGKPIVENGVLQV